MKKINKIVVDTHKDLIHIYFDDINYNISFEYSSRFKLVVDTIKREH